MCCRWGKAEAQKWHYRRKGIVVSVEMHMVRWGEAPSRWKENWEEGDSRSKFSLKTKKWSLILCTLRNIGKRWGCSVSKDSVAQDWKSKFIPWDPCKRWGTDWICTLWHVYTHTHLLTMKPKLESSQNCKWKSACMKWWIYNKGKAGGNYWGRARGANGDRHADRSDLRMNSAFRKDS